MYDENMGEKKINPKYKEPSVFEYHDYRDFLKAWCDFQKTQRGLSLREIAKQVEISHGYLSLVIDRHRNLSSKMIDKLSSFAKWTKEEKGYLKTLTVLADAKSVKKRVSAFKLIQRNHKYRSLDFQEPVTFEYLSQWLHVALREFAVTGLLKNDPHSLKNMIPYKVTQGDIKKSIEFLLENKLLEVDENGVLHPLDKDISCLGGIYQLSLGSYHKKMLELASLGIEIHQKEDRKQIGYTFALDSSKLDELKQILEETRERIKELENSCASKKDKVFHVNLSAFPLIGLEEK